MPLEAALVEQWNQREGRKGWAYFHACSLFAAAVLALVIGFGVARATPDHLVRIPILLPVLSILGCSTALLFGLLIHRDVRPNFMGRAAKFAWIGMLCVPPLFLALLAISYRSAHVAEPVRAQIVGHKSHGRSPFNRTSTIVAFDDGVTVEVEGSAGHRHACLLVRQVEGPFGFAWLRVEARSPAPGRGQLNWPVHREACFSDRPLVSLRG